MTTLFCRQATTIITLMNMNARKQKVWLNFLGVVWRKDRRRGRKLADRGQRAAPSVIAHPKISPHCTIRFLTTDKTYFFKSYLCISGKSWFCPGLTLGLCVVVFKCVITITNGSAFKSTNYLVSFINKKQVKLVTFLSVATGKRSEKVKKY